LKFFYKNNKTFFKQKQTNSFKQKQTNLSVLDDFKILNFSKFLTKDGKFIKNKLILSDVLKNLNFFLYFNQNYIYNQYPNTKSILENFFFKKNNYLSLFDLTTDLIKPPFVVKSMLIPKKLRKKTKEKYLIKIVYKNENKRLNSSFKQLFYYSNKFTDSKFKTRLYKSLIFSFLD